MDDSKSLLSRDNTLILKGGGICLMLIHHLFYIQNGLYDDVHLFGNHYLVQEIGIFGKLCVSLFVFLSGYGLMASYKNKEIKVFDFYIHRFKKLYLNYWFIWLLFVPIGVFVFNRTFDEVYGSQKIFKASLEFLGIYNLIGGYGYNPTWWFYSCIIVLYLLFPFLRKLHDRWPYLMFSIMILLPLIGFLPVIRSFAWYLLPFVVGMWVAVVPITKFDKISLGQVVITLLGLAIFRNFSGNLVSITDTLLSLGLALFVAKINAPSWMNMIFKVLGKHSMNIFLFHTFIYYFWFKDLIYVTRQPVIIFLELIASCLLISVFLEFVKNKIGFNKLLS